MRWLSQDLSKDQLIKLGVPETLTVSGTYRSATQSRKLVDLQIDQPNLVIEGVEDTARLVTATVEVDQFDPQNSHTLMRGLILVLPIVLGLQQIKNLATH